MNRTARSALWVLGAAAVGLLAAGCGYTDEGTRAPKRFYQLPQGWEEAFAHYPRGVVSESVLMIRKTGPKDIVANQDFEYVIEVYNPTDKVLLKNVLIRDYMAPGVRIRSSTPTWEYIDARREEGEWIPDLWKAGKDIDDKAAPAPAIESANTKELTRLCEIVGTPAGCTPLHEHAADPLAHLRAAAREDGDHPGQSSGHRGRHDRQLRHRRV